MAVKVRVTGRSRGWKGRARIRVKCAGSRLGVSDKDEDKQGQMTIEEFNSKYMTLSFSF